MGLGHTLIRQQVGAGIGFPPMLHLYSRQHRMLFRKALSRIQFYIWHCCSSWLQGIVLLTTLRIPVNGIHGRHGSTLYNVVRCSFYAAVALLASYLPYMSLSSCSQDQSSHDLNHS